MGVDMEGCSGREENDKDHALFKLTDASRYTGPNFSRSANFLVDATSAKP